MENIEAPITAQTKICITCKETLDINQFRLIHNKYRQNECKKCYKIKEKQRILSYKSLEKIQITEKLCSKCKIVKPIKEFGKDINTKNGLCFWCKECRHTIEKKRYSYNKSKERTRNAIYKLKIKESNLIQQPQITGTVYCPSCKQDKTPENFSKTITKKNGLNAYCKECDKQKSRIKYLSKIKRTNINIPNIKFCPKCKTTKPKKDFYKAKNTTIGLASWCKACDRNFAKEHLAKETTKQKRRAYFRNRHKNDEQFRISRIIRGRIASALRGKIKKSKSSIELLGCSIEQCHANLETLFWPGMTRENMTKYGWHIDHIIPVDFFDLTKPEEQRKCFHYTNLQPLWWEDNAHKASRLDWTPAESKRELPERLKHFKQPSEQQAALIPVVDPDSSSKAPQPLAPENAQMKESHG